MLRTTSPASRFALPGRTMIAPLLLTSVVLALPAPQASGGITSYGFNGFVQYSQTANNTPGTNPEAFYGTYLNYTASGEGTAANGTSGAAASGQTSFTYAPSGLSAYDQSGYITPAQLSDYMKQGTDFTAHVTRGSLAGQSSSVAYGSTLFSSATPYLTGNTYDALQGLNASEALTLTFNGFTAAGGATSSSGELIIYSPATGTILYEQSFSPGATSLLLSANTLAASTTYALVLDYSNLVTTSNAGFNGATFTADYDNRDFLSFTTAAAAVPEPASLGLMAVGAASVVLVARRRRMKASA